jgi:[histone H3]-lysine36 N-trimethyltransferase
MPSLTMVSSDRGPRDDGDLVSVKSEVDGGADFSTMDVPLNTLSLKSSIKSPSDTSIKSEKGSNTPIDPSDKETGSSTPTTSQMVRQAKISRSAALRKLKSKPGILYLDEPDRYDEATASFQIIEDCIYANKSIGDSEPPLECDCSEDWDAEEQRNHACGDDSCINRATRMECVDDCNCGANCRNQRFQRKEWAQVTVFKTDKKGYGLRADTDLERNDFIFEYIGEVITEPSFRRRMRQYDEEGIKHFYFMSLNKGEFVDATKKGNLGRFCNHSCNPNCYVDKWVVGTKLRMGIFAERSIKAGEELVFNYNVDRYGADPQPCYCGEPNCTGYIGGKTQTDSSPQLPISTLEALGLDDYDEDILWESSLAKKKKQRKTGEADSDYVDRLESKNLEEDGVTKVMAALMQCKEKWIAVRLLARIQKSDDERVGQKVIRMHGYRILKAALSTFIDDANVCLQVLDILFKLPRITRNKIQDSGIEEIVTTLRTNEDERVAKQSAEIITVWESLPVGYRIPRAKRDPNILPVRNERRDRPAKERSKSPPIAAPTGPKNSAPQRSAAFYAGTPRGPRAAKPKFSDLPAGWSCAMDKSSGRLYYYSATGQTQWTRPVVETTAKASPAPTGKELSHEERLQQIINSVTKNSLTPKDKSPAVGTPVSASAAGENDKKEGWRLYPEDKQKKIYENTVCGAIYMFLSCANENIVISSHQICA